MNPRSGATQCDLRRIGNEERSDEALKGSQNPLGFCG